MPKQKTITGVCLPWSQVLEFLDALPPWQELCDQVAGRCPDFDDETRKLMAAAVGVCVHNYNFPENLHGLLRMIGQGKARPFRWHGHVDPERWKEINTLIVAVQGWLQEASPVTLSRTFGLKQKDLRELMDSMGAQYSHITAAMLRRHLYNLIDNAVNQTCLGIVGDCEEVPSREVTYVDFGEAYKLDGNGRAYYQLDPQDKVIRDLETQIRTFGQSGNSFVSYARLPIGPFCQQKMLRYQRLALYRISKKWTDPEAAPPGGIERSQFELCFKTYEDAIRRWYQEQGPPHETASPEIYDKVFRLLGAPGECKRALIDCMVVRSRLAQDLQEAAFRWMREHSTHAADMVETV